jgi:hypothetical protein
MLQSIIAFSFECVIIDKPILASLNFLFKAFILEAKQASFYQNIYSTDVATSNI